MTPEFREWLRANHGKGVTIRTHKLVDEYDDETGRVPGVTAEDWSGVLAVPDYLLDNEDDG